MSEPILATDGERDLALAGAPVLRLRIGGALGSVSVRSQGR